MSCVLRWDDSFRWYERRVGEGAWVRATGAGGAVCPCVYGRGGRLLARRPALRQRAQYTGERTNGRTKLWPAGARGCEHGVDPWPLAEEFL